MVRSTATARTVRLLVYVCALAFVFAFGDTCGFIGLTRLSEAMSRYAAVATFFPSTSPNTATAFFISSIVPNERRQ